MKVGASLGLPSHGLRTTGWLPNKSQHGSQVGGVKGEGPKWSSKRNKIVTKLQGSGSSSSSSSLEGLAAGGGLVATVDAERQVGGCSWTDLILEYAKKEGGKPEVALQVYARMRQEGVQAKEGTFVGVLKACSRLASREEGTQMDGKGVKRQWLKAGRRIHSQLLMVGVEANIYVATTLVDMYAKCGSMPDARGVFGRMPHRNVVAWNAMILGYAEEQEGEAALQLYAGMQLEGVAPNERTLVAALKACSGLAVAEEGRVVKAGCLEKGRGIHWQAVRSGCELDVYVATAVVDMYSKCGSMLDAHNVFDRLPHRNVVSWTAMILGYAERQQGEMSLQLYARMRQEGVQPNERTFVGALKACGALAVAEKRAKVQWLEKGRAMHCQVVRSGVEWDVFVGSSLVDMYAKCGSMEDAEHVFYRLPHRNVVSWTCMMLGYAEQQEGEAALRLYALMQQEGMVPDDRTFVAALKACSGVAVAVAVADEGCLEKCRGIHGQVVKRGLEWEPFVGSALVDAYAKCRSVVDARRVFEELGRPDSVVAWGSLILAYAERGESQEALRLYGSMRERGLCADARTLVGVLKACGSAAALEAGKQIHGDICRVGGGLEATSVVATALIHMYGRCGSMADAQHLFDALPDKDIFTWGALMAGYGRLGHSRRVFHCFHRMVQEGVRPHRLTFLSLLTVCSHVGLVEEGKHYFNAMLKEYGIAPSLEHYTCMVDLLGRAGLVEQAVAVVTDMPFQADVAIWLSVLAACRKFNNVELGRRAFECAIRLDAKHASAYALMSNVYADAGMWQEQERIQAMRKRAGAWERRGESWWTDEAGVVHAFVVGDWKHARRHDIYAKLNDLSTKLRDSSTPLLAAAKE